MYWSLFEIFAFVCFRVFQTGSSFPRYVRSSHDVYVYHDFYVFHDARSVRAFRVALVSDVAALLCVDSSPPSLTCYVFDRPVIDLFRDACDVDVFSFLLSFIID